VPLEQQFARVQHEDGTDDWQREPYEPDISARVAELSRRLSAKTEISAERTLIEASRIGYADLRRVFDKGGNFIPVHLWPDDVAAMVQAVEFNEHGGVSKIRVWDKNAALAKLFKNQGLYEHNNRQKGTFFDFGALRPDVRALIIEKLNELVERG
jgi:ribulose 1,5-bisphosphate carboxylase large subunit-like protein